ncbi:hypothetical protein BLNAU_12590 [Blattamonas nauphoetae]|uniref:Uncharacterized protein n=1 Tax=Blattamonas nauphoetae TaxID=2049346 RepID=A0ABQ9XLW0_9EUKA|nr:hypothetical protein BLNAU_12590 [Blattamonas nauphoetae]
MMGEPHINDSISPEIHVEQQSDPPPTQVRETKPPLLDSPDKVLLEGYTRTPAAKLQTTHDLAVRRSQTPRKRPRNPNRNQIVPQLSTDPQNPPILSTPILSTVSNQIHGLQAQTAQLPLVTNQPVSVQTTTPLILSVPHRSETIRGPDPIHTHAITSHFHHTTNSDPSRPITLKTSRSIQQPAARKVPDDPTVLRLSTLFSKHHTLPSPNVVDPDSPALSKLPIPHQPPYSEEPLLFEKSPDITFTQQHPPQIVSIPLLPDPTGPQRVPNLPVISLSNKPLINSALVNNHQLTETSQGQIPQEPRNDGPILGDSNRIILSVTPDDVHLLPRPRRTLTLQPTPKPQIVPPMTDAMFPDLSMVGKAPKPTRKPRIPTRILRRPMDENDEEEQQKSDGEKDLEADAAVWDTILVPLSDAIKTAKASSDSEEEQILPHSNSSSPGINERIASPDSSPVPFFSSSTTISPPSSNPSTPTSRHESKPILSEQITPKPKKRINLSDESKFPSLPGLSDPPLVISSSTNTPKRTPDPTPNIHSKTNDNPVATKTQPKPTRMYVSPPFLPSESRVYSKDFNVTWDDAFS